MFGFFKDLRDNKFSGAKKLIIPTLNYDGWTHSNHSIFYLLHLVFSLSPSSYLMQSPNGNIILING